MFVKKLKLKDPNYPKILEQISSPPKQLFMLGSGLEELLKRPRVAVVGSRNVSHYGQSVTSEIASELALQGIVIISGLALGVDAVAHQVTVDAGGQAIAVLPCGLDRIYPANNRQLAKKILDCGGVLLSEYPKGTEAFKQNFVARNRLVAGLADGLIVTEAAEKSGSLHTARFALEQGKEVMAIPGNITSPTSAGVNNLIKAGATVVTSTEDVLEALGLKSREKAGRPLPKGANEHEQLLIDLLMTGVYDGHELLSASQLEATLFNQTLTMMELTGKVKSLGANQWSLR